MLAWQTRLRIPANRPGLPVVCLLLWLLLGVAPLAAAGDSEPPGLADALSPYLQPNAQNSVHWYPWGGQAFERARGHGFELRRH